MVQPHVGQKWKHKQMGRELEVLTVEGDRVRLQGRDMTLRMDVVQLWEHYEPVS